jgi:hypothetical protein
MHFPIRSSGEQGSRGPLFTAGAQSRVIAGMGKICSIRHEICSLSWCSAKARFLTLVSVEHRNDPVTGYCYNPYFGPDTGKSGE